MKRELIPIASCLGDDSGGGIFAIAGGEAQQIDSLSTTGIAIAEDKLARVLWNEDQGAELLVYDGRGVLRYSRVDEAAEPHDLAWDGKNLLLVSTATNSLLWIDGAGQVVRAWAAAGEGEAWHLNSVLVDRGGTTSARSASTSSIERGTAEPRLAGFMMDLESAGRRSRDCRRLITRGSPTAPGCSATRADESCSGSTVGPADSAKEGPPRLDSRPCGHRGCGAGRPERQPTGL
jgi:hypothetical protein